MKFAKNSSGKFILLSKMLWLKRVVLNSPPNYCQLRSLFVQSKCIFEWKNQVEKTGTLTVNSPVKVDLQPLDFNEVPEGDRADISLHQNTGDDRILPDSHDLTNLHPKISVEGNHIKVR